MIIAVHQPQYLPWLGYFDKIDRSDVFVFLDNVQFKKNEWQNRNKIKTADGWQWLTVPVMYRFPQMINEVEINNKERWQHKQRQTIVSNYKRASCWNFLEVFFEDLLQSHWQTISQLNIYVVKKLVEILGIKTPLFIASEMEQLPEDPDERLIAITKYYGADTYLAGSGGRDYMNMEKYEENGIKVVFQDYRHPVYNQLFGDFLPFMSVIDLMYNHGNESLTILRGNT